VGSDDTTDHRRPAEERQLSKVRSSTFFLSALFLDHASSLHLIYAHQDIPRLADWHMMCQVKCDGLDTACHVAAPKKATGVLDLIGQRISFSKNSIYGSTSTEFEDSRSSTRCGPARRKSSLWFVCTFACFGGTLQVPILSKPWHSARYRRPTRHS
jgi:hypothetical protein